MKQLVMTFYIVGMILTATMVFAFQNEPDGFRGIKWGTNLRDLPDMQYHLSNESFAFYTRKGDEMKIGDAELDAVYYNFFKEKFCGMFIQFRTLSTYYTIKQILFRKYGKGESLAPAKGYKWVGKSVNIILGYSKGSERGRIHYVYRPIFFGLH